MSNEPTPKPKPDSSSSGSSKSKQERAEASKRAAAAARKEKAKTVLYTVSQTNGQPLHLCEDGKWRSDDELAKLGGEE